MAEALKELEQIAGVTQEGTTPLARYMQPLFIDSDSSDQQ